MRQRLWDALRSRWQAIAGWAVLSYVGGLNKLIGIVSNIEFVVGRKGLRAVIDWIADPPDLIRTALLLLGVWLLLSHERKRNCTHYAAAEKLDQLAGKFGSSDAALQALCMLTYMREKRPDIDARIGRYEETRTRLDQQARAWREGASWRQMSDASNQLKQIMKIARNDFDFEFSGLTKQLVPPNVHRITEEPFRRMYLEQWYFCETHAESLANFKKFLDCKESQAAGFIGNSTNRPIKKG